jgi:RND family efflux transporter MFP subunit
MRYPFSATLVSVVLAALTLSACGKKAAPPPMPTPAVSVAVPLIERVVDWDDFTGRFEASQQVEVRARTGGYLQSVHFRDGQFVHRGQLLFTLDARPAQALLAAAQAQANVARTQLKRAEALLAAQAISKEELESRRASALVADAAVRSRQLDVEFTRVVAPVSGIASDRRVDPGNVIAGGSSTSDVLTTIVSTTPIYFSFDASEGQLLKYQRQAGRGSRVQIRLQDEADYRWDGTVDFSDNGLGAQSGAIRMRATVANPSGFLKPGLFGRARVEGSGAYEAMLIPDTAVVSDAARKVAYVVAKDGTVSAKPLQLGPLSQGLRVIRGGLVATDQVIVNGTQRARPGGKVKPTLTTITRSGTAAPPMISTVAPPASTATPAG